MNEKKAVVLLSGGLDSTTTLAVARAQGFSTYALSFRYGQRHEHELACAKEVARYFGVREHRVVDIDLAQFGGSALTGPLAVPKDRPLAEMESHIPITYVPARNTIFLSVAVAWAESIQSTDIFIGVNSLDYSGYPDCRPEYIEAFQRLANLGTKVGVSDKVQFRIHTPLIHLSKKEIIQLGQTLGVAYGLTSTCYDPSAEGRPCGRCDACQLRRKGFSDAGVEDPLTYAAEAGAV